VVVSPVRKPQKQQKQQKRPHHQRHHREQQTKLCPRQIVFEAAMDVGKGVTVLIRQGKRWAIKRCAETRFWTERRF
jgi:hypothetical protein